MRVRCEECGAEGGVFTGDTTEDGFFAFRLSPVDEAVVCWPMRVAIGVAYSATRWDECYSYDVTRIDDPQPRDGE